MIRSLSAPGWFSASVEYSKHFRHIRLVVDYEAIDFDPGVSLKGHLLCTDDHLSGYAVPLQKACRGCGPLETARLFPIPDAGHVYRGADLRDGIRRWNFIGNWAVANFVVQCGEIFSCKMEIEMNQLQVGLHHKKQPHKNLQSHSRLQLVPQKHDVTRENLRAISRPTIKLTTNFLKLAIVVAEALSLSRCHSALQTLMVFRYCKVLSIKSILKGSPIWPFGLRLGLQCA